MKKNVEFTTTDGTIYVGGIKITQTQSPYISDDGTQYMANATDYMDNDYLIVWEVKEFWLDPANADEFTDEGEACDWETFRVYEL